MSNLLSSNSILVMLVGALNNSCPCKSCVDMKNIIKSKSDKKTLDKLVKIVESSIKRICDCGLCVAISESYNETLKQYETIKTTPQDKK